MHFLVVGGIYLKENRNVSKKEYKCIRMGIEMYPRENIYNFIYILENSKIYDILKSCTNYIIFPKY